LSAARGWWIIEVKQVDITFREITPLFRFELEPEFAEFLITGNLKDAKYEIKIAKPAPGENFATALVPWADDEDVETLNYIHLGPQLFSGMADYFLIVDVIREYPEELEVAFNTVECIELQSPTIDALRLVASQGLLYYTSYHFRSPTKPHGMSSIKSRPVMDQYFSSHLGLGPSILHESEFASCQAVFQKLLTEHHNRGKPSDAILSLALEYHQVVFKLEKVQHSFLILMTIFEALFKLEEERNIENAATKIGNQLGATPTEKDGISKEFYGNADDNFGKLRNKIAHGNPSLDLEVVKAKYPILYGYITQAIILYIDGMKT
jgi:hypothetical protein